MLTHMALKILITCEFLTSRNQPITPCKELFCRWYNCAPTQPSCLRIISSMAVVNQLRLCVGRVKRHFDEKIIIKPFVFVTRFGDEQNNYSYFNEVNKIG